MKSVPKEGNGSEITPDEARPISGWRQHGASAYAQTLPESAHFKPIFLQFEGCTSNKTMFTVFAGV